MTAMDSLRRRDRGIVAIGVAGAAALAWVWLVPVSLDMYGDMTGPSAWMMQAHWDLRYGALIFLMWVVMMVGMMLPSAVPAILRLARAEESGPRTPAPARRAYAFGGGYLLAWTVFSLAATLLQWGLAELRLLSPQDRRLETAAGALRAGLAHGAACVGCCWALMLLLFAGGVMSLPVIGAIALLVLLEKLVPFGAGLGRLTGVALFATGVWLLLS